MKQTVLLLMAQFGPRAALPLEEVRKEYFSHVPLPDFIRKLSNGSIPLPTMQVEKGIKATRFISMMDLAIYLDTQMEEGRIEYERLKAAAGTGEGAQQRFVDLLYNGSK